MFGFNPYSSPAAETPLQILFSDDETLGVAFLRHATENCATVSKCQTIVFINTIEDGCSNPNQLCDFRMKKLLAQ